MDADARGTGVLDVEAWLDHEAEREARLWGRRGCDFDKVDGHERDLHAQVDAVSMMPQVDMTSTTL
jgi:hypothetical protein